MLILIGIPSFYLSKSLIEILSFILKVEYVVEKPLQQLYFYYLNRMNIINKLLILSFFIAYANICFGQVADDFEFIDHKVRNSHHGVSKVMGDEFIYVGHHGGFVLGPMTSVIKVNTNNNSVDTIFTTFSSQSSIQEFPDGTFHIFLFSIFDYDVGVPGFYAIEFDGTDITVKAHTPYDDPNPIWNNYQNTTGVVKGEGDVYYLNSWSEVFRLNADLSSDTLFSFSSSFDFHQNSQKEIFAYDQFSLYSFSEDSLSIIHEFDQEILDIENNEEFNDILFEGVVERWNLDFSQLINRLNVSTGIKNFYQLEVDSSSVRELVQNENKFFFIKRNNFGPDQILYENEYEDQAIVGFHPSSESKMLLIGSDSIPEIGYYTNFFRNIDFENEVEYQSRDVSIDSLVLYQFASEKQFQYINYSTGDSVFLTFYYTDLNLSLSNQSAFPISELDCKSGVLNELWFYFPQDYFFNDAQLMPGESLVIKDTLQRISQLQEWTYAVPGADFRFNHHPNRIGYPDFSADFEEVSLDINLKLFPNPASESLRIEIDKQVKSLEIFNSSGQLVIYKSAGANLNLVDVSRLRPGNYFLRLSIDGEKDYATQQFVKISQ